MGTDKAMLAWHGHPLIEHMRDILFATGVAKVVISGNRPQYNGIPDRWPDAGPVGGLASVADVLDDGELLIVPVDMPELTPEWLAPLLLATDEACACWIAHPLPMRMRLDAHTRDVLADMVSHPGRDCSIGGLQRRLGVAGLPVDATDTRALRNCNTPDEWNEASL